MALRKRKDIGNKEKPATNEKETKNVAVEEKKVEKFGLTPTVKYILRGITLFLIITIYSNLYMYQDIPYKRENEVLREALKDPELVKYTYEFAEGYEKAFKKFAEENNSKDTLTILPEYTPKSSDSTTSSATTSSTTTTTTKESEIPKETKKTEILPEDDDAEVIGDMKGSITGGEIYTVSEAFEKLGLKRISTYEPKSKYEEKLLKEFTMEREPPENIAKKTDYYSKIIERGLKKDERFFVKKINDKKNYGLFANVDILANEVIGIYTGIIQEATSEVGGKYEWYYSTIPDREKEKMIELRVNAKNEGSHLRFVNHSKYYNTRIEYVPYNNMWYILFVSNRFISRGEEITTNYREKTKRMPEKIIDKWDKVEMKEYQKLYDEYMKLYKEYYGKNPPSESEYKESAESTPTEEK